MASATCQVRSTTSPTRPMAWESEEVMEKMPMSCSTSSAAMVSLRMRESAKATSSGMSGLRWWQTMSMSRCSSIVLTVKGSVGLVDAGSTLGRPATLMMSGACPPPAPSVWKVWMTRPSMALMVSSTKPNSLRVSEWMATWMSNSSAIFSDMSIEEWVAPQSSWTFRPMTPARTCSASGSRALAWPLPSRPMLMGRLSTACSILEMCQAPGVTVVALLASDGPVPPPISVVTPPARATGTWSGLTKCTCVSMPPAVRILPSPAMMSVATPMVMFDAVGDVRVAGLADLEDVAVAQGNVGLVDARVVQHDHVGDDGVRDVFVAGALAVLAHAVTDDLAAAVDHFLTVFGVVVLNFGEEFGVGKPDGVACGGAVQIGVLLAAQLKAHLAASFCCGASAAFRGRPGGR